MNLLACKVSDYGLSYIPNLNPDDFDVLPRLVINSAAEWYNKNKDNIDAANSSELPDCLNEPGAKKIYNSLASEYGVPHID